MKDKTNGLGSNEGTKLVGPETSEKLNINKPKKKHRLPKGITVKNDILYYYIYNSSIKKGGKGRCGQQKSTGLKYTPENVQKAVEIRNAVLAKLAAGKQIIDANITMRELGERYLESKSKLADTTYATTEYNMRKIMKYFGDMQVKRIRTEDINLFLDKMAESGSDATGHEGEPLSKRTVNDIQKLVRYLFKFAVSQDVISSDANPAIEAEVDKDKITKYRKSSTDHYLRYDQAMLFLKIVHDKYPEFYPIFYLVIIFGLRREEANGLKWSAIDLDYNHTLSVQSTVTRGTKVNRVDTGKTDESVNTAFPFHLEDDQIELLRREKQRQVEMRKKFGNQYVENDYFFKNADGSLHDPSYLYKVFKKILRENPELPQDVTFHGLRKTTASVLVREKNVTPKQLQTWMRHSDIEITLRLYAQIEKELANEETSKTMAGLFKVEF